jgi:DNA primase
VAGAIPEEFVAEVRERTDIVQVIGQHVQLKRSGTNHKGLCPFHDEKTPSFNVNGQRQFFHCFGCHESGDVITFLMKVEGRRFGEVLEDLAARAGMEVPRQAVSPDQDRLAARQKSERQQGMDLNRKVADLYRRILLGDKGQPARDYLVARGLEKEVAESFCLGFAPPSGSVVVRLLESERTPLELGERLGLVARRREGEGYHDRFWNRLIFPVLGAGGEVLGFGGRLIAEADGPKYVNTPETALYRKGEVLFGLHAAAATMRKNGQALLVEGNVDVLQMHQQGFAATVAPMGTALTSRQVQLLRRFAREVVAIFDGDEAGNAAALKAVRTLTEGGVEGKIASLPTGHDPDSFLRERGAQAMAKILEAAVPAVDFLIDTRQSQMEDTIPGRARLLEEVAPVLAKLPSAVDRDLYMSRLALVLRVDLGAVRRAVAGGERSERAFQLQPGPKTAAPRLPPAELELLGVLAEHPHLFPRAESAGASSLLTNDGLRATYRAAMEMQQASGRLDQPRLLQAAPLEVRDAVAQVVLQGRFASDGDPTKALDDCLRALERNRLQRELQDIRDQIAQARTAGNTELLRALAVRSVEVEREIHETR